MRAVEFSPNGAYLVLSVSGVGLNGTIIFDTSQLFSSMARPVEKMTAQGRQRLPFLSSSSLFVVGAKANAWEVKVIVYKVGGEWEEVWDTALQLLAVYFLCPSNRLI